MFSVALGSILRVGVRTSERTPYNICRMPDRKFSVISFHPRFDLGSLISDHIDRTIAISSLKIPKNRPHRPIITFLTTGFDCVPANTNVFTEIVDWPTIQFGFATWARLPTAKGNRTNIHILRGLNFGRHCNSPNQGKQGKESGRTDTVRERCRIGNSQYNSEL